MHSFPNFVVFIFSLATVAPKGTLISVSSKTPAVLTPMIRVLLRLWCHECARVFSDRLIGEDKLWFSSTLHKVAVQHFCETSADSDEQGKMIWLRDAYPNRGIVVLPFHYILGVVSFVQIIFSINIVVRSLSASIHTLSILGDNIHCAYFRMYTSIKN